MMRKFIAAAAFAAAAAAPAGAAQFTVSFSDPSEAVANNFFQNKLTTLPAFAGGAVTSFVTSSSASLSLDAGASVEFFYLGSESYFFNKFTAGSGANSVSFEETSNDIEDLVDLSSEAAFFANAVSLGSVYYGGGAITDWAFTTSGAAGGDGKNAALGQNGFGFFLPGTGGFSSNYLIIGFDDENVTNPLDDDNHDDFLLLARISPVPESSTWAMLLAGFATVGAALRRGRRSHRMVQAV